MKILISNSSDSPIYEQIVNQIKSEIIKGELEPGSLLPSIRNLAKELQISVITTKRAYDELEREGFIESVRGKGSFVSGQNQEFLKEKRIKIVEEKLTEVVAEGKMAGLTLDNIYEILKIIYDEANDES